MDTFIIYKAAMKEPLNLNYIILKEMADVRNHNTRDLPFGAFLTWIFLHLNINLDNQPTIGLIKRFSKSTIKKGKNLGIDEGEREEERMDVDVEDNLAIIPMDGETDAGYGTDPSNLEQEENAEHEMTWSMKKVIEDSI